MNNAPIYRIVFIAVLGGFLFGLNMAGISGAVNSIKELFSLTDNGIGLMVSALTAGCLVGALFTGGFADRFGRRRIFLAVALLFVISSAGCALSYNPPMLTLFRFLSGLAVGADSVIGPMYISEIAPAGKRGRLVSFQQFAITIGILAAYLFDYLLLGRPDDWRWMLAVPALFGTVFLVASFFSLPESPRWQRGAVRNDAGKVAFRELFSGRTGRVVALGTLLAAFQQITGINAVINYAPIIFEHTGVGGGTALLQSCLVGFINFLSTIVALWLVDTKGRRTLLLWGAAGMWVVTSEIFPDRIRARALSFSTCVSWICTFLTVQFSPAILNALGGAALFGIFGVFALLALLFVKYRIPETRGKSLEQIERELNL